VGRFLTALLLVAPALVLPAWAADEPEPDCSKWAVKGVRPGMTLGQAQSIRTFNEFKKFRDAIGYRRYLWQAPDKPEKIELHVDTRVDPPEVMGVTTTIPSSDTDRKTFLSEAFGKWGRPQGVSKQGAFNLYSWVNVECDVAIRASVMNQQHDVGVFMALGSLSGRDEFARRMREQKEAEVAAGAASGDPPAAQSDEGTEVPGDGPAQASAEDGNQ
jgi:hypothetical protein